MPGLLSPRQAKWHRLQVFEVQCGSLRGAVLRRLPHKTESVNFAITTSVCVVTEEQPKVPQNLCSSQNYVTNKM